jgi:hypothetical protein
MISENALRKEGYKVLSTQLGILESERFIAIIKRESFDYTKWRENLFADVPAEEFLCSAADFRKENKIKAAEESTQE